MNIAKFLRTAFFTEQLRWLLLSIHEQFSYHVETMRQNFSASDFACFFIGSSGQKWVSSLPQTENNFKNYKKRKTQNSQEKKLFALSGNGNKHFVKSA